MIETGGHCLICLRLTCKVEGDDEEEYPLVEGNPKCSRNSPCQDICHYLKVNLEDVYDQDDPNSSSSPVSRLEEFKLQRWPLCGECKELSERFSEHYLELIGIQKKLALCLESIQNRMAIADKNGDSDDDLLEEFKRTMMGRPETSVQYGIVERLRRETLQKCSYKLSKLKSQDQEIAPSTNVFDTDTTPEIAAEEMTTNAKASDTDDDSDFKIEQEDSSSDLEEDNESPMEYTLFKEECDPATDPLSLHDTGTEVKEEPSDLDDDQDPPIPSKMPRPPKKPKLSKQEQCKYIEIPESGKVRCRLCPKQFKNRTHVSEHYRKVHPSSSKTIHQIDTSHNDCYLCDRKFNRPGDLVRHQRIAHSPNFTSVDGDTPTRVINPANGKVQCKICSKEYKTDHYFQEHYNSAHAKKKISCDLCNIEFTRRSLLWLHRERIHRGKEIKCQSCGKVFTQTSALNLHRRSTACGDVEGGPSNPAPTHQGTFDCLVCGKDLKKAPSLAAHMKTVHADDNDKMKFLCSQCGKGFPVKSYLTKHIKTVHSTERGHLCDLCGKGFALGSLLNTHKRVVHGTKKKGRGRKSKSN